MNSYVLKFMRAVALTCALTEFKGHLVIKVDASEEVRVGPLRVIADIFISHMRGAKEEARNVNTDWYTVSVICSHESVVIMAYTRTHISHVAFSKIPRCFLPNIISTNR